jgi:hypothetical protein
MKKNTIYSKPLLKLFLIFICLISSFYAYSQYTSDSVKSRYLYRLQRTDEDKDTIKMLDYQAVEEQPVSDSLAIRLKLIQDSILAREQFIRDSIARRQQILDSLNFLQRELPVLFDAYFKTVKDDIIISSDKIEIIGDSVLGDFRYFILPFSLDQPFTPWKVKFGLTGNNVIISTDPNRKIISGIQAPFMNCTFLQNDKNLIVINELSGIIRNQFGQYYQTPVDSVFFDRLGRIVKIKRYIQFYQLVNPNKRGAPLFLHLSQVKQFTYGQGNQIAGIQIVNFCSRWKETEIHKVCNIINYELSKKNQTYLLTRRNDPPNNYSDGTFTFEFDMSDNLKGVSFNNLALTESWQRSVELTADGNVNCYVDKVRGMVKQSLCMIYHLNDPGAKYKVETITTVYEDDGISYFQRNNTTGLSRTRDRLTMEWGPWK